MAARRRRQDWSRPLGPSPSRFAHLASWYGAFSAPPDTSLQAFGLRRQRDASDRIRNGGKSILARTRRGKAGMLNSERWRIGPPTSAADSRRWPDPRKGGPSAPASGGFGPRLRRLRPPPPAASAPASGGFGPRLRRLRP